VYLLRFSVVLVFWRCLLMSRFSPFSGSRRP